MTMTPQTRITHRVLMVPRLFTSAILLFTLGTTNATADPPAGDGGTQYVPGTAANTRAPSLPKRVMPPPGAPPLPGACAGSVLPARQSAAGEARWVVWRGARANPGNPVLGAATR